MSKVLVIEDEVSTREIFLDCLGAEGFEAIGAANGAMGIQLAQQHLPSLVVCDIMMPVMDGYGVLSALRREPATALIPVVFLTAKRSSEEVRYGMQLGVDDYLTKPSSMPEVLRAINTQIKKRERIESCYASKYLESNEPETDETNNAHSIFPEAGALQPVFDFIEANYHKPITLPEVAHAVGYSPAYLTSQVGDRTGRTVNRWIVERRMLAARELLQESNHKIEDVAALVGYQHACHFSRQFRKHHNQSPQAWRKEQRSKNSALQESSQSSAGRFSQTTHERLIA